MVNDKKLFYTVDYYNKLNPRHTAKIIFAEFGLPRKFISDVGMNSTSETFLEFCGMLNIQQVITLYYHHQSNGQVEVCIKFFKCSIKKYIYGTKDINLTLLQIQSTPGGVRLPSPATMLFNRSISGLLPQRSRAPINIDNDNAQ